MWIYSIETSDIPDAKILDNGTRCPSSIITKTITTTESDCADLAGRLMVPSVQSVCADVRVYRQAGQRTLIMLECDFTAHMNVMCGVTLEPYAIELSDTVTQEFSTREITPENDDDDVPEHIAHGVMDITDIVAQLVALAIPAYPRSPHADLDGIVADKPHVNDGADKPNPFAKLSDLKGRLQ